MNDIAKQNTQTRLLKAMEHEGLKTSEAALYFDDQKSKDMGWMSCFRGGYWHNAKWSSVLTWVNFGQSLKEYSEKHGKVLPEIHDPNTGTIIEMVIKDTPVKETKQEPKRASKGELIDMLIEEKALLKSKIDAIDLLLKHYIS